MKRRTKIFESNAVQLTIGATMVGFFIYALTRLFFEAALPWANLQPDIDAAMPAMVCLKYEKEPYRAKACANAKAGGIDAR